MFAQVLYFFANYLIEVMAGMLVLGLFFRWSSYRKSIKDEKYFSTFVSEVEKEIASRDDGPVEDMTEFLSELLDKIKDRLPTRSVRNNSKSSNTNEYNARNVVSLRDYVTGDKAFFHAIITESATFKSKYPPNYNDLAERVLENDVTWTKLFGFLPQAPIARLNDVLPGIFVVFGIFGTFIGISLALPEIANIDFNNLEGSGEVLTKFVLNVTYAMKTSIAGILFSLIMTMLNTLAPVRGTRNKTFKKVSNCFANIWISLHGKKKLEEELIETLPEMAKDIKELKEALTKKNEAA